MAATPREKALRINLDARTFGTFAEIGAGQEVARWFFHAGKASATVAKSISAYDKAVSDDLYGPAHHYVSRERLQAMLDREYTQLLQRSAASRGETTAFFVFADTVATRHGSGGHGWFGLRFQTEPRSEPSQIVLHAQLLDLATVDQQKTAGILGVNLIDSAFHSRANPPQLIGALADGLSRERAEVDLIKFSGPAFAGVDNRLMSLQLIEQRLTDTTLFTVDGEVEQPSEVLHDKPVLLERGGFRPVTNITKEMLDAARDQLRADRRIDSHGLVVLMEMTLNNLMTGPEVDHGDFLARVDTLSALGRMVMISNYTRFDRVTTYLRKYTPNWIVMALGAPTLIEIFDEKFYGEIPGGLLEGLGRLFQGNVKLCVYPMKSDGSLVGAGTLTAPAGAQRLYDYFLERGQIEPIRDVRDTDLHIYPADVLAKIQAGDPLWESMVPPPVAAIIKQRGLFGYRAKA